MRPLGTGAELAGVRVLEHLHRSNRLAARPTIAELREACAAL